MEVEEGAASSATVVSPVVEDALALSKRDVRAAVALLLPLVATTSETEWKTTEKAIAALGQIYVTNRDTTGLRELLERLKQLFGSLSKAKTAKIVRQVLDYIAEVPESDAVLVEACKEWVAWCKAEKRTFLRQRIELRLATLYLAQKQFQPALQLVGGLVHEVKRLDDKALLVEIFLLESQIHHTLRNIARARASLTAARTNANAMYCPANLQCALDKQSGIVSAEEHDYKTAYSYFYEAFEGYNSMDRTDLALPCLKLMILCKIMNNLSKEVDALVTGKLALRYAGRDVDGMRAVSKAYSNRSLFEFERALEQYKDVLSMDPLVNAHLAELQDSLLQQNLQKLVEAFSRVEVQWVADEIRLPVDRVEAKLSQMILDKKIDGTLDQGSGCLVLFEPQPKDELYPTALATVDNLSAVVDALFDKCKRL